MKYRGFLDLTNSYARVKNIVVRLSNRQLPESTNDAFMLSTHFDSMPSSSGASDAGSGVVVLLETMRAISRTQAFPSSIIFMFNGAEELGLQAAHGFIAHHRWAPT